MPTGATASCPAFSLRRYSTHPARRSGPSRCECLRVQYDGRDRLLQNYYPAIMTDIAPGATGVGPGFRFQIAYWTALARGGDHTQCGRGERGERAGNIVV
eukprot:410030-Prymnesium_polylepis.1